MTLSTSPPLISTADSISVGPSPLLSFISELVSFACCCLAASSSMAFSLALRLRLVLGRGFLLANSGFRGLRLISFSSFTGSGFVSTFVSFCGDDLWSDSSDREEN